MKGWLCKQEKTLTSSWKKYWVVVEDDKIKGYKSQTDDEVLFSLELTHFSLCELSEIEAKKHHQCIKLSYFNPNNAILSFATAIPQLLDTTEVTLEPLFFYSESKDDAEWVQCLSSKIASFENAVWMKSLYAIIRKNIAHNLPRGFSQFNPSAAHLPVQREDSQYMSIARDSINRTKSTLSSATLENNLEKNLGPETKTQNEDLKKKSGSLEKVTSMKQGKETSRQQRRISASHRPLKDQRSASASPSSSKSSLGQSSSKSSSHPSTPKRATPEPPRQSVAIYKNNDRRVSVEDVVHSLNRRLESDEIQAALQYANIVDGDDFLVTSSSRSKPGTRSRQRSNT